MSHRTSPSSECPDADDSVLSIKGQPKRFSKPLRTLKNINFDEVLNDSLTEASIISTSSPVKHFKAKKNKNQKEKVSNIFAEALETTAHYDSTFIEKDHNSQRLFKSEKEITGENKNFSKAFETMSENSFSEDLKDDPVSKTFKPRKKETSKDYQGSKTFSNAFHTTNKSLFDDDFLSSQMQTTFRAANFQSKKGSSGKNHHFSIALETDSKYGLKYHNQCDRELSLVHHDLTTSSIKSPKRCRNNAFKRACRSEVKNDYSRALDTTIDDHNSYLENEVNLSQENPAAIKFSQSISPISLTKLEIDKSSCLGETSETSSKNIQEDFTRSKNSEAESVINNSSNSDKLLELSVDLVPILNEIKTEMEAGDLSAGKHNSPKIKKSNHVPNETSKIDSENRKNSNNNDDSNLTKFCVPKRPLRKKSSNIFTDHDLSLYLLSKGSRPKKPIPQHVDRPLRLESGQKRQGKENKNSGRLKRPSYWATNKLYTFLETTLVPKKAENFVVYLADIVSKSISCPNMEERCRLVDTLKSKMAKLKLVKSDFYFYDFIFEFLPFEFQDAAIPSVLLFSEKLNVPNFKCENLFTRYF